MCVLEEVGFNHWGVKRLALILFLLYEVEGVWVHLLGDQGVRGRVILVIRECFLNSLVVHLVLPMFDVTGSLGFPPH